MKGLLHLPGSVIAEIGAHARSTYPEEACGVLIGKGDFVSECRRLSNAWPEAGRKQRYETDGRELMALEREFLGTARGIVGFYHSHPDVPAWPSPYDLERAWSFYIYVILSIRGGIPGELRAWRRLDNAESFAEIAVTAGDPLQAEAVL